MTHGTWINDSYGAMFQMKKKKRKREIKKMGECDKWHGGKWGEVSPTIEQFDDGESKK